jgi:hypothetical protein
VSAGASVSRSFLGFSASSPAATGGTNLGIVVRSSP